MYWRNKITFVAIFEFWSLYNLVVVCSKFQEQVLKTFWNCTHEDEFERLRGNHEELCAKNKDCEELHVKNNHEDLCAKSKAGPMSIY